MSLRNYSSNRSLKILLVLLLLLQQPALVYAQAPHTQGMEQQQKTLLESITEYLSKLTQWVMKKGVKVGELLKKLWKKLLKVFGNFGQFMAELKQYLKKILRELGDFLTRMKEIIWGFLAKMTEKVMAIFNKNTELPK